jgi:hypothetical protein
MMAYNMGVQNASMAVSQAMPASMEVMPHKDVALAAARSAEIPLKYCLLAPMAFVAFLWFLVFLPAILGKTEEG